MLVSFAPSPEWLVETYIKVLSSAGQYVRDDVSTPQLISLSLSLSLPLCLYTLILSLSLSILSDCRRLQSPLAGRALGAVAALCRQTPLPSSALQP
jgi:hypothetical protein